jgi:uncharacterized protein (TIGR00255 family)
MILSMTGFGKSENTKNGTSLVLEIRSLNSSKGLDLSVKLPSKYRTLEAEFRNKVAATLFRGKIDVTLSVKNADAQNSGSIKPIADIFKEYKAVADSLNADTTGLFAALLQMPELNSSKDEELSEEETALCFSLIDNALNQTMTFRTKEGEAIYADLSLRLNNLHHFLNLVKERDKNRLLEIRVKMNERLETFLSKEKIDANRFEQEVVFYLEKMDINEEVSRLTAHIEHFKEALHTNEPQLGRKLNFISQEMGREINTIGSKANDFELQKVVVGMKDELEKVKEQTSNIL